MQATFLSRLLARSLPTIKPLPLCRIGTGERGSVGKAGAADESGRCAGLYINPVHRKLRAAASAASHARIPVRLEDSLERLLDLWHPSSPGVNQDDDLRTIPSAHLSGP